MTIRERECNQGDVGVNAVRVYCFTDHGSGGKLLYEIHHGYGDTLPISPAEMKKARTVANKHESETRGKHFIDIVLFTKNKD